MTPTADHRYSEDTQLPAAWRLVGADPEPPFEILVDGRRVPVVRGQTVGAALWAAGLLSTRRTLASGERRGVFCGIGYCFDCLVTVNDRPALRACLIQACPGDAVRTGVPS